MVLRVRAAQALLTAAVALVLACSGTTSPAAAHSSGCHSSYSCPSDHHSYIWYDADGRGWSCARPGSETYNPAWDTQPITHEGLPYYCHVAGSSPPAAPVPPVTPPPVETEDPEPAPLPAYMGTFGFARFALPQQRRPRELHPFSADDGAYLYGLRWHDWGEPKARARGKASVNTCDPYCAVGKRVRRRGARAVTYRLREGRCDGESAQFYTRVLMRFPKRYGISAMTVKLKTRCD